MDVKTALRYVVGLTLSAAMFWLVLPAALYRAARCGVALPLPRLLRLALALALGAVGLLFMLWSAVMLLWRGQGGPTDVFNVAITPRTKHLVIDGPYRWTRNPMIFGAFCGYVALALWWNSAIALGWIALGFVLARFYLRRTEEKRLRADFGVAYEEYRRRVGMILPRPPRRRT